MNQLPPADAWAVQAAALPLAFAQVREDPRLDTRLARLLPDGADAVMIASGGETLVELTRLPLRRIHAVDLNPAQLDLARLKCELAAHSSGDETARLLGHESMPADRRGAQFAEGLDRLGMATDRFGPPDFVALHGVDHAGRYERCFAELRAVLPPWRERFPLEELDEALARVMSLQNLVALFGREATQNPRLSFDQHFAKRTRVALARDGAETNPFLRQMYAGRFAPGNRYDWLESNAPLQAEVVWHQGRMLEVLNAMPSGSVELAHLSNILDWLTPAQAAETLEAAARVLKPGGRVIVRQLNSTLEITGLTGKIRWDAALGRELEQADRSFFYPNLLAGIRV